MISKENTVVLEEPEEREPMVESSSIRPEWIEGMRNLERLKALLPWLKDEEEGS
jgi:hypothetical protein